MRRGFAPVLVGIVLSCLPGPTPAHTSEDSLAVAVAVAELIGDTLPIVGVRERLGCSWRIAPCVRDGDLVGPSTIRNDSLTHLLARHLRVPVVPEDELRTPVCPWVDGTPAETGYLLEILPPVFVRDSGEVVLAKGCIWGELLSIRWFTYRLERLDGVWTITELIGVEMT